MALQDFPTGSLNLWQALSAIDREVGAVFNATPPILFLHDSFSDTTGTALTSHTGQLGASWTIHPDAAYVGGVATITDAGRVRYGSAPDPLALASVLPPSPEYIIEWDLLSPASVGGKCGIVARWDDTAVTGYLMRYQDNLNRWEIQRAIDSSFSVVATSAESIDLNRTYHVRCVVTDDEKAIYVDGVKRCSTADNNIEAAGRVGIHISDAGTDSTGLHLDNLVAYVPPRRWGV